MQDIAYEDIEFKDYKKASRMLRSKAARMRRKETKLVREARLLNEWARARRERKKCKTNLL